VENRKSVDQRQQDVREFVSQQRQNLTRQGAVVAKWRRRGTQTFGPYYLLVVRDVDGRQQSIYLGAESAFVDAIKAELIELQSPRRRRRQLAQVHYQLRRELGRANVELAHELAKLGLARHGHEIRGWSTRDCQRDKAKKRKGGFHEPGQSSG
jgi:hypothetical protein